MQPPSNLQHAAHKPHLNAWVPKRARGHAVSMAKKASISKLRAFVSSTTEPEKPHLSELPHAANQK